MKLFLDTEFNGFGGQLISIALAPEGNGSPFYEVLPLPEVVNPWVKENVVPFLEKPWRSRDLVRRYFHQYLKQFRAPEIVCDWHADAEHFCALLAGDDYGSSLDFECTIRILKTPPGQPPKAKVPHNALYDAIAFRDWYMGQAAA
jgi:hypothetical protein